MISRYVNDGHPAPSLALAPRRWRGAAESMEVHHGNEPNRPCEASALEQGQALVGQKAPFKPKDVWAMRAHMERGHRTRELALFNLGIDSKLRGCDLVALKLRDIQHGAQIAPRAIITQHKTGRPVQFEITPPTRSAVQAWVMEAGLRSDDYLFPSRIHCSPHICTRQYARMLRRWVRRRARLDGLRHALDTSDQGIGWKARSAIWALTCTTRWRLLSRRRSKVERAGPLRSRGGPSRSVVGRQASVRFRRLVGHHVREGSVDLRFSTRCGQPCTIADVRRRSDAPQLLRGAYGTGRTTTAPGPCFLFTCYRAAQTQPKGRRPRQQTEGSGGTGTSDPVRRTTAPRDPNRIFLRPGPGYRESM
jgi:hypothetical protein